MTLSGFPKLRAIEETIPGINFGEFDMSIIANLYSPGKPSTN